MKDKRILLWLDDYRNPYLLNDNWVKHWAPQWVGKLEDVVWVKSYVEFVKWIKDNGLPTQIAFDHDLADEHYAPPHVYKAEKYNEWEKTQEFKEKTGMDAAKWLVDYCMDNDKELPMWVVQSANPNGAKNINSLLTQFVKFNMTKK
jgi:hypothetical protein